MRKNNILSIIIPILLFFIISIILLLSNNIDPSNLYIKQIIWFIIGFILIFVIYKFNLKRIYNNIHYLYIFLNIILLLLLIFGKEINNSKCWITFFDINIQPSEFMKIVIIIYNSKLINEFKIKYKNPNNKEELLFLFKIFFITFIPSFLTFLEPDTGNVIVYLVITITMLFISGIRYRWFIIILIILLLLISFIFFLYFYNQKIFIDILGNSFFLRIDRLLEWNNKSGYQLNNSLSSIGASGLFGLKYTPLYFPESNTDFIFTILASNYGFIFSLFFIILIFLFDYNLLKIAFKTNKFINKYIIIGISSMIIFSQFQNIGMTFSILPIMGITLPFISYGGSSLITYMICIGIILNIEKKFINKNQYFSN